MSEYDGPVLYSVDAERSVLGSILIDPPALHEIGDRLQPRHFHNATNRAVYKAMRALDRGNVAIDTVTVVEALERTDTREPENGWTFYVIDLLNAVPTSVNIGSYARIVGDYGRRREMVATAQKVLALAHDKEIGADEALGAATQAILEVQKEHDGGTVLSAREYVRRFIDDLEGSDEHEVIPTSITGWNEILLGGLRKPFAHFIAARPKMGKSALAMQLVGYACMTLKKRAYLATTEMSDLQFTRRIISQQTGIPAHRLMKRNLSKEEWSKALEAAGTLSEYGPDLDVSSGLTPSQVRSRAMRIAGQKGLDLIVVDHIHEMVADGKGRDRHLELGQMARDLRDTAKALDVPIIIVAQLNRSVDSRHDKTPQLSDFREAGALEETAYTVTFVHREHYYDETADEGKARLIVAAHRDGPTGTVELEWKPELMRFQTPMANRPKPSLNGHKTRKPEALAL